MTVNWTALRYEIDVVNARKEANLYREALLRVAADPSVPAAVVGDVREALDAGREPWRLPWKPVSA